MKKIIKNVFRKFGLNISRYIPDVSQNTVISLKSKNNINGNMLLSYRIEPFLLKPGEILSNNHTNYWESFQIAMTFLKMGFNVDVIDFRNRTFIPEKDYSILVSARTNLEKIANHLSKKCIKIAHLDTAHWVFNNHASFKRGLDLLNRRNRTVTNNSLRIIESNLAIEYADYATILGNQFTIGTYEYARKPIFRVPLPSCLTYPFNKKNLDSCRKNFLWFGSSGLVHKGLDLVIEAFMGMPDYNLTICGPVQEEKEFENIYYEALYKTPNIRTIGWVDVDSDLFKKITDNCLAIIYPSCAEGGGGSVITCMQTGLIPIVSNASGVDVHDFGIILADCSIDEIRKAIYKVSNLSDLELKEMAYKTWAFARSNHSRDCFAKEYKNVIQKIILNHQKYYTILDIPALQTFQENNRVK